MIYALLRNNLKQTLRIHNKEYENSLKYILRNILPRQTVDKTFSSFKNSKIMKSSLTKNRKINTNVMRFVMMLSASIQTYIHMLVYVAVKVKSAIATFSTKTKKNIHHQKKLNEK